jgi:recombinational DNA repair ATPase RecF
MIIKEISLRSYRNYDTLDLSFYPRLNVFLGEIEAIMKKRWLGGSRSLRESKGKSRNMIVP